MVKGLDKSTNDRCDGQANPGTSTALIKLAQILARAAARELRTIPPPETVPLELYPCHPSPRHNIKEGRSDD